MAQHEAPEDVKESRDRAAATARHYLPELTISLVSASVLLACLEMLSSPRAVEKSRVDQRSKARLKRLKQENLRRKQAGLPRLRMLSQDDEVRAIEPLLRALDLWPDGDVDGLRSVKTKVSEGRGARQNYY